MTRDEEGVEKADNGKSSQTRFDAEGYDEDGYNKDGFDRSGFDHEGYNRRGIDRDGYNRAGYKNGFDRSGHNRDGFLRTGYNDNGIDVSGRNTAFYFNEVSRMTEQITRAKKQMAIGEFDYALNDIRVGLEIGAKSFIRHYLGDRYLKDNLCKDLKVCKKYLPDNFYDRLQSARHQCSPTQHDTEERGNKAYNQVYFAWKTLEEFRDYIQNHLVTASELLYK